MNDLDLCLEFIEVYVNCFITFAIEYLRNC